MTLAQMFGLLIQAKRIEAGLTEQQLAAASGRSVHTIQRLEAGDPLSITTTVVVANVLLLDIDQALGMAARLEAGDPLCTPTAVGVANVVRLDIDHALGVAA